MEEFQAYTPLLFAIASRMLGNRSDAEDIVQESYLRYATASVRDIKSLKAYLTTVVTRLCLDHLKSARVRREQFFGPRLTEPTLAVDQEAIALHNLEVHESLMRAFLILLECLNPAERTVFLLHEVFAFSYQEIAALLGTNTACCRQLFRRARLRIAERRPRFSSPVEASQRLTACFLAACQQGDLQGLLEMRSKQ